MLLAALALSFFGMFIMFYSLLRSHDNLMRFVNKKHTEFLKHLTKVEESVFAMSQMSGRIKGQMPSRTAQAKGRSQQSVSSIKNAKNVVLDDVFPSNNVQSGNMFVEDVFTLQPDENSIQEEHEQKNAEGKGSILELLQL